VHFSRPSIDVLFQSAADVFRSRLLGVILTGANEDGAAGLAAIRARGGVTVVQDPATAEQPAMPSAALAAGAPSAILSVEAIAALFAALGGPHAPADMSRPGDTHV
jgi:two-component system, chemotaxis family, protein-glutamate methylesterase/glutaminase